MSAAASASFFDQRADSLDGGAFDFAALRGRVTLITNVASRCGATKRNYKQLVALEHKYRDAGLSVMCFPSQDFRQELKKNDDIAAFVQKFGVDHGLLMMDQIHLNGDSEAPVWAWLKQQSGNTDNIGWNFRTKFLVARDGMKVERFERVDPNDLEDRIKELLSSETKAGL